ncbi:hypothetical protein FOXYS1_13355 [Fusarium oxysporum]|uniref:Enoyl reductase (ER) domain-containing protein n=1 Tax=Fusarium oxysporum TaxID=5507 RepID=A0A8H4ZZT0_FUSOX|nr:hypothetical protein FOXYS1_13355 [Fusarium oxysporum]
MKAVGISKYGPVTTFNHERVKACSVNPIDHKVRSGTYDDAPDYYEHVPKNFHIIGFDGAGVIEQTGPDCQLFKVGDEVSWVGATTEQGSYAEYQLVSELAWAKKPKNLDFVDTASYGLTFMTAYQSLYRRMEVKPEEQAGILIMILYAPFNSDLLAYKHGYVYIVARTEYYTESVAKICAPFGKVCTIVQADVSLYGTEFMSKSLTFSWDWLGSAAYHNTGVEDYHEMLGTISRLMEDGSLFSTVGTRLRLTLEGLKEAHKSVEGSTTVGKIALGVDEPGEGEPFA